MIKFTVLNCYFTGKYYVQKFICDYSNLNDLKKVYRLKVCFPTFLVCYDFYIGKESDNRRYLW